MDPLDRRETGAPAFPTLPHEGPISLDAKDSARAMLRSCCGDSSAFVRVGAIAKMLGMSSTSIHSQIRQSRFPIPHRRVGHSVLVKFEDLVEWYCAEPASPPDPRPAQETLLAATRQADVESPIADCALDDMPLFETPSERSDRIKRSVLASMARQKRIDLAAGGVAAKPESHGETAKERAARIHREAVEASKRPKKTPRP